MLTQREKEVFELLIANYSIKRVAKLMNTSDKTARNHISNVILKLRVRGRTQAVMELLKLEELTFEQAGRESVLLFFCNIRAQRIGKGTQDAMLEMQGYEATVWEHKSIRI